MKIFEVYGDVLESVADVIIHSCNAKGAFNSGVAKVVREKYPEAYEKYKNAYDRGLIKLGGVQVVVTNDGKRIANLIQQENYGYDGQRYTSYDAVDTCMYKLRKYCEEHDYKSIAMPYHMCSDRGGADWDVILAIITSVFKDSEITIEIWKL